MKTMRFLVAVAVLASMSGVVAGQAWAVEKGGRMSSATTAERTGQMRDDEDTRTTASQAAEKPARKAAVKPVKKKEAGTPRKTKNEADNGTKNDGKAGGRKKTAAGKKTS